MDEERMFVTLDLEDEGEVEFEVYSIFEIEEFNKEYAAMIRADEEEVSEFYLFEVECIEEDGEDQTYEVHDIEDDEEREIVEEAFSQLLDSDEWNALVEDDE